MKSHYRSDIKLGRLASAFGIFLILLDTYFVILGLMIFFSWVLLPLILILPLAMLNFFMYKIIKVFLLSLLGKPHFELEVFDSGIRIKNEYLQWHKIKSISFQTGRLIHDREFSKGFKLPVFQRMFVLDKSGKEYSCIIDIDYFMKENRSHNNLRKLNTLMYDLGKASLISDWAEKR
ncbi:MAG: hypothetical protein ABIJ34_03540 [archaeon]